MPSPTTRFMRSPSVRRPFSSIVPEVGFSAPARRFKRVVLPEPLGPINPTTDPSSTVRDTPGAPERRQNPSGHSARRVAQSLDIPPECGDISADGADDAGRNEEGDE